MKKNILMHTNIFVCIVIVAGFLLTALLSYRTNFSASIENIEQVSSLTSEGIYYQISTTFSKPVNISLTMANDSLLHDVLLQEPERLDDSSFIKSIQEYLHTYQSRYGYDSVFLVSAATNRYYSYSGLDRVLERGNPEDVWYFDGLLGSDVAYSMNVDNDQVAGADNAITVFVNCKVLDNDGALLGVVGVGIRIDGLQRTLQDYRDQFGINAYLLDDGGTIELSTDYSGYDKTVLYGANSQYSQAARQDILDWKEDGAALRFWSLDGSGQKRSYVVARYLPEIRWHLVVEQDTSDMIAGLNTQLLWAMGVIAVILTAILLIITHVIRRFNEQIVRLTQSIEQERQAVFEKATEQLYENIYELDVTRNLPANKATEEYFESLGVPPDCPYEKALHMIAEKQIKEEFRRGYIDTFSPANVLKAYKQGTESLTYEFMISKNGSRYYWIRITARIVRLETDGSVHMLVYRQNIDAEKRRERRMRELAQTDEMTGLLTKTATQRRVKELLEKHPEDSFVYFIFDIDNFKGANDRFGHHFGDSVICGFAEIIREHFRKSDVLGRMGGDEFVVFAQGAGRAWAEEKADTLRRALCHVHTKSDMSWQVSTSIGVALSPEHGTDADTLYKNADTALYRTKARGKNGYTVFEGTS